MSDRRNAIVCSGVTKRFAGGHTVLDRLTFTVPAGSVFGFLGLNGAGKTTTIRILAGMLDRDGGEITILGSPLRGRDPALLRRMGFVLDEPLYFEWMTAEEYLEYIARIYGLPGEEARFRSAELFELLDLTRSSGMPLSTFSAGMRRKVAFCAALIHAPQLIILDEPLEAVDAVAARDLKDTLRMMASRGATVFLTSHALDAVERLCDDIAILHHGAIALTGPPREIPQRAAGSVGAGGATTLEEVFVRITTGTRSVRPLSFLRP